MPGGGGAQICDLYDVNPSMFGRTDFLVTRSTKFGDQSEVFNGIDATISGRLPRGIFLSGGVSTGGTATNNCFPVDTPVGSRALITIPPSSTTRPDAVTTWQFCGVEPVFWQPQLKLVGSYPLPWWGLLFSSTYQNVQGPTITATYVGTNAQVAPSLGRNLSAGANGTVTVELMEPGRVFEARIKQLDVRLMKVFRFGGRRRIDMLFDMYNALNNSSILAVNNRFGSAWLRPTAVQTGRVIKLGVQTDF